GKLRRADEQALAFQAHGTSALADFERGRNAVQGDRLARAHLDHRRSRHARPLVQLGEDPAFLVEKERLDVAERGAQRGRYRQAMGVDRDAERPAAAPHEPVGHEPLAEPDEPRVEEGQLLGHNLACSFSIHSSASLLMVCASRPAGSMVGPMRTVTVPGRFTNALRGQNRPALWATGTTGAPLSAASQAPPSWYGRRSPGGTRVPSGKTTTQNPCARRFRPRRAICRSAATPLARSMAMGLISARPQPKNGIQRSSRLRTCTCGGKMSW